jgi:hypothetical protein
VDFAEEDDVKGFVWVEFDKGGIVSKDFVKTDARPYRTVRVPFPEGPKPVEVLKEEVGKYFDSRLVLRVKVYGTATPIGLTGYRRSELLTYCQGKVFHCFVDEDELSVQATERPDVGPRATPLQELEAHFKKQMETASEEERTILIEALRLSKDKLQEAGAW